MHPIYGGKTPEALEHMKRTVAGLFCIVALLLSAVAGVQLTNLVSANPPLINSVVESLELWSQTYGGTGGTNDDLAYSLVETSDGGFALAGGTYSFGAGDCDFWLVKTDANGNMEWNQTYGGAAYDRAFTLVETSDGGLALAGNTGSFGAGDYDFWLVKTDANGNMEWNCTYGGTNGDSAHSLVETSDGGLALAGNTGSFGAGGDDFWLVKTDANGNMEWNQTYGGAAYDNARSLVETSDGGLALAGYTQSISTRDYDFGLVRTDPGLIPKPGQSEPPEPFPILLVATASGVSITVLAVCLLYYYKKRLTINP
jgi:predicted secreted protein